MRENADFHDCDDFHDLKKILTNLDNHENLRSVSRHDFLAFSLKRK
jgi:hypothetical protein